MVLQDTIIAHSFQSLDDREKSNAVQGFLSSWRIPPVNMMLGSDEVHAWRATLDLTTSRLDEMEQVLSADEQARAKRFRFQKDRKRFIAARGLLRTILAQYVAAEPGELRFCYGEQGKPELEPRFVTDRLRFNLSHAEGLALYAVTRGRQIGVDVERIKKDFDHVQIARHCFSDREVADLHGLPERLKTEAFFTCWTRKEAYVKARGEGLSFPLKQFDVSLSPGEPARILRTADDPQEADRWCLRSLEPSSGYVAALAVEGSDWRLKCWIAA